MKSNYINLLRGLAIFLMLWGHCIQVCIPLGVDFFLNPVFKVIYSFHMPLFMLISGYLFYYSFEKRDLKDLMIHRCKGLVQIIVVFGIFSYFATTGLAAVIKGDFSALINGDWLPSLSGLWFVWSVLSATLVVGVVCKTVKKLWLQIILLVLASVTVLLFPNAYNNLYMYPYYVIGFYFAKYQKNIPAKLAYVKYAALLLFPVMMFFFGKQHYIYTTGFFGGTSLTNSIMIDLFRWGIGLIGSVFVAVLMELFYKFVVCKKPEFILWRGLSYIGQKSLQVYALSIIVLSVYLPAVYLKVIGWLPQIDAFFIGHMWIYNFIFTLVLAVVYAVGISLIIKLFEKLKISKVLFGR